MCSSVDVPGLLLGFRVCGWVAVMVAMNGDATGLGARYANSVKGSRNGY